MAGRRSSSPTEAGGGVEMIVGELSGRVHELIHTVREEAQKSEARGRQLAKLEDMPADVKEIKDRLNTLELDKAQRTVERGLIAKAFQSPLLNWIVTAAVAAWAVFFKGGTPQ